MSSNPFEIPETGLHLLEASAGTGKTWTLMVIYLRQVLDRGLMPEQILAVTFTKASAAELRRRIREALRDSEAMLRQLDQGQSVPEDADDLMKAIAARYGTASRRQSLQRLRAALSSFDRARIETIHSFCQRVLRELAFGTRTDLAADLSETSQDHRRSWLRHWFQAYLDGQAPLMAALLRQRFVRAGKSGDFELGLLDNLAALADARPNDLSILPAKGRPSAPDGAITDFLRAGESWQQIWAEDGPGIKEAFAADPAPVKGQSYRRDTVRKALESWDRWRPGPSLPANLERFSQRRLDEAWRYATPLQSHRLWPASDALLAASAALDACRVECELDLQRALVETARVELRRDRIQQGDLSFDDLLQNLRSAVRDAGFAAHLAQQLPVMLIDEFQDTDPVQWEIFQRIFEAANSDPALYLVGDPKQAIYGFRNADLHTYLRVRDHVEKRGEGLHVLDTNYRSQPRLVQAVNGLYQAHKDPFVLPEMRFHPVKPGRRDSPRLKGPPLTLRFLQRAGQKPMNQGDFRQALADDVALEIRRILASEPSLEAHEVAVLVFKRDEAQLVARALLRQGVPAVIASQAPIFQSEQAQELLLVLRAVLRPDRQDDLASALATRLLGATVEDIRAFRDDEALLAEQRASFGRWRETWMRWGAFPLIQQLMEECRTPARLLAAPEGPRDLTNFRHLAERLHHQQIVSAATPSSLLAWYEEQLRVDHHEQRRLATDAHAVQVVTMHKAKGLEFDLVFCPYLWSQGLRNSDYFRFNDNEEGLTAFLRAEPVPEDQADALANAQWRSEVEREAEAARLIYVALTRARERCIVHWGCFKGMDKSPATQLLHPGHAPEELLNMTDEQICDLLYAQPEEVSVESVPLPKRQRGYRPMAQGGPAVVDPHRVLERSLGKPWRRLSYSGLARGLESVDMPPHAGFGEGASIPLADFPRGARVGDFFHELFEHHLQSPDLDASVARLFLRHGLQKAMNPQRFAEIFSRLRSAPVARGLDLSQLTAEGQLPEASFLMPLAEDFRADDLAQAVLDHGGPELLAYGDQLASLSHEQVAGFLTGSIDLVYRQSGFWGLVDYKSNHLGDQLSDYDEQSMAQVMVSHHYLLQGWIYAVALIRMIRRREPSVDPYAVFDGARFFFLRGAHEEGYGVYQTPWNPDLLQAIDRCFAPGVQP